MLWLDSVALRTTVFQLIGPAALQSLFLKSVGCCTMQMRVQRQCLGTLEFLFLLVLIVPVFCVHLLPPGNSHRPVDISALVNIESRLSHGKYVGREERDLFHFEKFRMVTNLASYLELSAENHRNLVQKKPTSTILRGQSHRFIRTSAGLTPEQVLREKSKAGHEEFKQIRNQCTHIMDHWMGRCVFDE